MHISNMLISSVVLFYSTLMRPEKEVPSKK